MGKKSIRIICPQCDGVPRPLILHVLCNGTGLIDGQDDPVCNGTGQVEDDVCGFCDGVYTVKFGTLSDELIDDIDTIKDDVDTLKDMVQQILDFHDITQEKRKMAKKDLPSIEPLKGRESSELKQPKPKEK